MPKANPKREVSLPPPGKPDLKHLVVLQTCNNSAHVELVSMRQAELGIHRQHLKISKTSWTWRGTRLHFGKSTGLTGAGILGVYDQRNLRHLKRIVADTENFFRGRPGRGDGGDNL